MKKNILVFLGFGALAVVMTYPLFFKMNSHIAGFFSTDEASVWYFWWLKYAHIHKIPSSFSYFTAAPFGTDFGFVERVYPVCIGIRKLLVIPFNGIISWNLEILAGFIVSAFFVYLAVRYLKQGRIPAFFSGIIFAFCPYHFVRAWQHIGFSHTEWLALFLFSILRLKERISKWNIILVFLSLYLVFSFDLYYAYFSLFIAGVFIVYSLLKEQKKAFKAALWVMFACLGNIAILAVRLMPVMKTMNINVASSAWGMVRSFEDLFSQSARPLSYLLPASVHPVFGKFTERFVGTKLYGTSFTEHTLYLGWIALILAFVAVRRWRRNRKESPGRQVTRSPEDFYIGFFSFLAFAAWLFSQPPWWQFGPIKIFMPSFFMYKILPMFRAYCRFGIVVMLAVAVLAGFGLRFVLERFKSRKTKIAITALFCGLVLFEFWNWPPYKVIDVSRVPAVYYWLKSEPGDFALAEYPLDLEGPNEIYKLHQTAHEKRIINGTIPGTYAHKVTPAIRNLSSPETPRILKWMGVKYVLVHRDGYTNTGLIDDSEELDRIPQNEGLKLIKTFPGQECPDKDIMCVQKTGPIEVYEVAALPKEPEIEKSP